jgi:DNA-binding PadR family transcriptional regulator
MHLRYALLALLADGEAHGYRLLKAFNHAGPFWHRPQPVQILRPRASD